MNHVGRRAALYRTAVAGGGGRAADRGRGSESRTLCDKQIRVDLLGGGGIGGWLSAVQRETVMTEERGLLGRAAAACQNEGYDMCSPCDPG